MRILSHLVPLCHLSMCSSNVPSLICLSVSLSPSYSYSISASSVSSGPCFVHYPTSEMAAIQSIECAYVVRVPPFEPLERRAFFALTFYTEPHLITYQPLALTSHLQASLSATVQSEGQPTSLQDVHRGAAAHSSSCSSKTCPLISYTTKCISCMHIPSSIVLSPLICPPNLLG